MNRLRVVTGWRKCFTLTYWRVRLAFWRCRNVQPEVLSVFRIILADDPPPSPEDPQV